MGKADWLTIKKYISYSYKCIQEHIPQEIYNYKLNSFQAILYAVTIEVKMIFGKQEVHFSNRRSCHGTKLLKSAFNVMRLV